MSFRSHRFIAARLSPTPSVGRAAAQTRRRRADAGKSNPAPKRAILARTTPFRPQLNHSEVRSGRRVGGAEQTANDRRARGEGRGQARGGAGSSAQRLDSCRLPPAWKHADVLKIRDGALDRFQLHVDDDCIYFYS